MYPLLRLQTVLTAALCAALLIPAVPALAVAVPPPADDIEPTLDVDYVPTPMPTVRRMLELAGVDRDDHLVDLGSGDGRILITAARKYGVRSAVGIEIDPWLVEWARARALDAGVGDRVKFVTADLFETDFANADVVTMYLLPQLNLQLRPYLLTRLSPGTRIVSHSFDMGDWEPDARDRLYDRDIFMWIVPAQVAGTWEIELNRDGPPLLLRLRQQFQYVEASASLGGKALQVDDLRLSGRDIAFRIGEEVFKGRVEGQTMQSTGTLPWFATLQ